MKQVVREFRGTKKGAKASRPMGTAEKGARRVKGNWVVRGTRGVGRSSSMGSNGRGTPDRGVDGEKSGGK